MPMLLLLLAFACLAGAVFLFGELATVTGRQRQVSLRRAATYGAVRRVTGNPMDRLHFHERVLVPLAGKLARLVLRFNPRTTLESVQAKLLAAGVSRRVSPTTFLALKGGFAIGGFAFGLVVSAVVGAGGILFIFVFLALGFVGPDFVISSKARSRREAVKAQLPDALDLLAVSVEAGLGFDGAIAKITEHMDGELADECQLALGEMRIGESRQEALKKMGERVNAPELQSFVRAIIQADQLGISLGRILRVQAVDSRNRRQMAAEERAMKAPIKMLFPTVMFIFPAMFVVILGPAVLNILETFQF
jgi:tight adherence protein C